MSSQMKTAREALEFARQRLEQVANGADAYKVYGREWSLHGPSVDMRADLRALLSSAALSSQDHSPGGLGSVGGVSREECESLARSIHDQLYDHKKRAGFDAHDGDEWSVTLTAREWRRLEAVLAITPPPEADDSLSERGWKLVPREAIPEMLATVAPSAEPASEADYEIALRAVALLPPSEHPDLPDILAELARDWRAMWDAAPPSVTPTPPSEGELTFECHKLDTPTHVFFYEQDFYVLSNFSSFMVWWRDILFPTSEHAYHWAKFTDGAAAEEIELQWIEARRLIMDAMSAHDAFKIAQELKNLRRPDWDDVKVDIMRDILRAKVAQHEYVRRKLLATGDRLLVEDSWRDDYWGWGPNRDGQNMLGKLWMEVRAELRAALSSLKDPTEHKAEGGPERKPTHRCKVCGALWISWPDSWSLYSPTCGTCCDNVAMGDQIEALSTGGVDAEA